MLVLPELKQSTYNGHTLKNENCSVIYLRTLLENMT